MCACVLSATAPAALGLDYVMRTSHMPPPPLPAHRDLSATGKRTPQSNGGTRTGSSTPLSPPQLSVPNSPSAACAYPFPPLFPPDSPRGQARTSTHLREPLRSSSRTGSTPSPTSLPFSRPSNTLASLRAGSPAPSYTNLSSITASSSRASSRRPSAVNYQSFLEGVTHTARIRSPSLRGHSRRSSIDGQSGPPLIGLDGSVSSLSRRESFSMYDHDDDFIIDDIDDFADEQPPVFEEGDRLALGFKHQGYLVTAAMPPSAATASNSNNATVENLKLEIIRKVGSGSYAVVYLARQILYDPSEDESWDPDDYTDGGPQQVTYGKEFALKCLCKHNLDEDLLHVQRFEVELHASLPAHPNIVSLHAAFETPLWLFLVMEYCPGQDLFYWLEQHRESIGANSQSMHPSASFGGPTSSRVSSEALYASTPRPKTSMPPPPLPSSDSTPPSPSILSSTADSSLLDRRRLRLISRMFEQMCEAVAACHSVGVSHRDIKPENFICSMDDVDTASLSQTDRKVIVKLTDWGLGSNEVECGDFDCGSKPYMAYECRNNLGPSYRPREADIWSLGIVLLNLLFHRCPWADPSPDDPDFAHFRRDRIRFLERRFEGMGREVATYLAERVFCDDASRRVSAHEFGKWGNKLGRYMGGSQASVSDAALPMQATTARPSMAPSSRRMSLTRTESRPSPRASLAVAQLIGHSLASQPIDLPSELKAALDFDGAVDGEATPSTPLAGPLSRLSMTPAASNGHRVPPPLNLTEPSPPGSEGGHDHPSSAELSPPGVDVPPSTDADVAALIGARQRRRKRGARKTAKPAEDGDGNGAAPAAGSAATAAPSEAAHPHSAPLTERDAFISDLAVASEALARQLSKRPSAPSSLSAPALDSAIIKKPSTGLMSKVRAAVMNGNPQLEAFRQTAYERDVTLGRTSGSHIGGVVTGISSAPARLGVTATAGSQTSSTGSWASSSSWSADGAPEVRSHWASTTDRRSRVAHHHGHTATTAPSSSSASPSRLGNGSSAVVTPVSSMSSVSSKPSALASSPPPARTESPTTIEAKSSKFSKMLRAFAG